MIPDRILNKIEATDYCWLWKGAKCADGYGRARLEGGKSTTVTRVIWELLHGPIPDLMCVLHKCDNPICVNPDHLFLGTKKDNWDDMIEKNRQNFLKGTKHGMNKLSESDVLHIRASKIPGKEIAPKFGLHRSSVWRIRKNQAWQHLSPTIN